MSYFEVDWTIGQVTDGQSSTPFSISHLSSVTRITGCSRWPGSADISWHPLLWATPVSEEGIWGPPKCHVGPHLCKWGLSPHEAEWSQGTVGNRQPKPACYHCLLGRTQLCLPGSFSFNPWWWQKMISQRPGLEKWMSSPSPLCLPLRCFSLLRSTDLHTWSAGCRACSSLPTAIVVRGVLLLLQLFSPSWNFFLLLKGPGD